MKITTSVSPELMALAKQHGMTVRDLINFTLSAIKALADEPDGSVLALYNPRANTVTKLPFPSVTEPDATNDRPKLVVVATSGKDC